MNLMVKEAIASRELFVKSAVIAKLTGVIAR